MQTARLVHFEDIDTELRDTQDRIAYARLRLAAADKKYSQRLKALKRREDA